ELGEARLDRLELLARALEDRALHVEFLAGDEIHPLEAGVQKRAEVALEIVAERAEVLRQGLRELPGKVIQVEAVLLVGHLKSLRLLRRARFRAYVAGNGSMIPLAPRGGSGGSEKRRSSQRGRILAC